MSATTATGDRESAAVPCRRLAAVAVAGSGAAYLLVSTEWLFLVTKPSMFTVLGWPQRVGILVAAALLTALGAAGAGLLLTLAARLVAGRWARRAGDAGFLVPAVLLAVTVLLLVENFTKTVFGFNLGSFTSPVRYLYAAGWLLLVVRFYRRLARRRPTGAARAASRVAVVALALVAVLSVAVAWMRHEPQDAVQALTADGRPLPNILILSSDGLNAERMSVYGYGRRTTPFLESLRSELLISENHFTNASPSSVSIGTLLNSKSPLTTGVLNEGDAFHGHHVFEHLPGLLRQLGYYNIDVSARYYGDAYDLNLRQGFHVANGRSLRTETLPVLRWVGRAWPSELYLLSFTLERARQRLLHAFGIADMRDYFDAVAKRFTPWTSDERRLRLLKSEIARAPRPFFAQVHLMDTHRVKGVFTFARPRFARGTGDPGPVGYDDTIAAFDEHVEDMVAFLEQTGELDRTLLIVNSDHSADRHTHRRLPLLFRFPRGEHRGLIPANTQRLDVAPTIVSYLGLDPPEWMAGESLIGRRLDPLRPIIGADSRRGRMRRLALVQCQRAFVLELSTAELAVREVAGHTAPCAEDELLGEVEARGRLFAELAASPHLSLAFPLQVHLLWKNNHPEVRRSLTRAMRDGSARAVPLGLMALVAQVHQDFWTRGSAPALVLLRNDEGEARSMQLEVYSGRGGEFPTSFYVQDEGGTREHLFPAPGRRRVALPAVPAGGERLLLVWSDRTWQAAAGDRRLGVRLSVVSEDLARLLRQRRKPERHAVTRRIVERKVPAVRFGDHGVAANVHGDLWTRGTEPAGVVIRNRADRARRHRITVRSGGGRSFPLSFSIDDGSRVEEYVFASAGHLDIELAPVPPGADRLFIIWSERAWTPESESSRKLGVRIQPERGGRASGSPRPAPTAPGS